MTTRCSCAAPNFTPRIFPWHRGSHVTVPTHKPARLPSHPAELGVRAAVLAGEDHPPEFQQHRADRLEA